MKGVETKCVTSGGPLLVATCEADACSSQRESTIDANAGIYLNSHHISVTLITDLDEVWSPGVNTEQLGNESLGKSPCLWGCSYSPERPQH